MKPTSYNEATKIVDASGLEIKRIVWSPFGDQLEKYSHQLQILSCQFV